MCAIFVDNVIAPTSHVFEKNSCITLTKQLYIIMGTIWQRCISIMSHYMYYLATLHLYQITLMIVIFEKNLKLR